MNGKVYLIGAGPGDAGLITVRGLELLEAADCIIYDSLVNRSLLRNAKKVAELISAGKRAGAHSLKQDEINSLLVEKARQHKIVVRLKGGDPCIFARGAEEAAAFADAGIDFEIVPGITAAIGAAAYAGIMLTDRRHSSAVAFITGHEAEDKDETGINWQSLAKFGGTLVFYMGVSNVGTIASNLIANGMRRDIPAAIVADATLPTQRVVTGRLDEIEKIASENGMKAPALLIIGEAARVDRRLEWFAKRPLLGKRILITRDAEGNAEFARGLEAEGASVIEFDAITFEDLTGTAEFRTAIESVRDFDWVIFTSANGVRFVFDAIGRVGKDSRIFAGSRIAAIGPKTAESLGRFGIRPDFVPDTFTGEALGRELVKQTDMDGRNVLLLRSAISSPEFAEELRRAVVSDVPVYTTKMNRNAAQSVVEAIEAGQVDWITFTSSSTARGFFEQVGPQVVKNSRARIISIGPATSEELRRLGMQVCFEASVHTTGGIIESLKDFYRKQK